MRTAFIQTLCAAAAMDERIWLVCGDLGYSVLEGFARDYPQRFVNAGVAEQNMIGLAAGLAHSGKIVFVYSIVNFPVFRCLEQVRNDVAYHNLNVKIVAVGGGLVYGGHGYSHHGAEDLAAMGLMPNMTVVAPGDPIEARLVTAAIAQYEGPCYLRLGRGGEPVVHSAPPNFTIGKAIRLRDGSDLAILSTGGTLALAQSAADELKRKGIHAQLWSVPTLWPLDRDALSHAAATRGIVTIEEHGWGGLGTLTAEWIAESATGVRFRSLHLDRQPVTCAGSHDYLRGRHGLTVEAVIAAAHGLLS